MFLVPDVQGCRQERPFGGREVVVLWLFLPSCLPLSWEEFDCAVQAGSPVEGSVVVAEFVPGAGGIREVAVAAQPFTVLVDPAAQPRPAADQRLVRQVHRRAVEAEQPCCGQPFHDRGKFGVGPLVQLGTGGRAPGVRGALTGDDQSQEKPTGGASLGRCQRAVHPFRAGGDGAVDAADLLVPGECQDAAPPSSPGLQQGVGEHGQPAGLVDHLLHDPGGQLPLDDQTGRGGRPGDCLP